MFETIDYRTTRAFQICVVFIFALALQRWLKYSHAGWIGFAVMMIYAGFDSGTSLHRTIHRAALQELGPCAIHRLCWGCCCPMSCLF